MDEYVVLDCEYGFLNGTSEHYTVDTRRDDIVMDDERVKITLKPDVNTVDEILITRSALAYMRTTQRTIVPDLDELDAKMGVA